jgi:hypothetical protein
MGSLDDAIREHLELKRRLGASDEEIERKEDEAFGKGTHREPPASQDSGPEGSFAESELATAEPGSNGQPEETLHDTADYPDAAASTAAPDEPAGRLEEEIFEPDEVPREESLDPGLTVRDARRSHDEESEPSADWVQEPERDTSEDVLEETPEFLEETPEGDSLWFDQRPPKDFDFD